MISNLSQYKHLLVLAVVLAILSKLVVILKLGLRSISKKDNKSHIFKHLRSTATRFDSYNSLCFKITDKANSKFDLKVKEALHINWTKPNLDAQQSHLALTLSLQLLFPLLLSVFVCFSFVFLQFYFIYCFHYLYANYWHLLLY